MRRTCLRGVLIAVLAGTVVTGCGSSAAAGRPPTLPAGAVPYLTSAVKPLSPGRLAREAGDPKFAGRLRHWGFEAGADRYFQGESRRLQMVDSRTLRFRGSPGATAFMTFMRTHLDPILGSFAQVSGYLSGGRRGILAVAQECQCHLANPTFLAVVVRGGIVSWLEINGPGATRRRVKALLGRAP